jgi:hypothetical protein
VARLAISKGFLADYVKLDKDVRRAVDQAVATFARHPQPGMQLERPQHVNDDRLRILPVGTRWRGVVLTAGDESPEDTYSLVTVLPQDQADAYVISYQSSVNRALKILKVLDEEVTSQLQPTPEDKQLSADVSDPSLTRPAVAAQIPPALQLLASEADLKVPQTALPESQSTALNMLANNTTVDEAPARVANATEVPERQRGRLSRPHPLTAWRRFRTRTSAS